MKRPLRGAALQMQKTMRLRGSSVTAETMKGPLQCVAGPPMMRARTRQSASPFCGVLDALCIEKPKHIAFRAPATFQKVVSCHQIVSFPRKSGKPRSPNIDPT